MRYSLGFDPGETHLGVALITHRPAAVRKQPQNDLLYRVRWFELWDLKRPSAASWDTEGGFSREECSRRLCDLITNPLHPILYPLLLDPEVDVYIENQEGFDLRRPEVGAALMPMCLYTGVLLANYVCYGHRVRLVGKKSKWGWTSFIHTKDYNLLNTEQKRARRKACCTLYTWNLIMRQQKPDTPGAQRSLSDLIMDRLVEQYRSLPFDDKAHIADSILLLMFAIRKIYRKSPNNTISLSNWAELAADAESRVPFRHRR